MKGLRWKLFAKFAVILISLSVILNTSCANVFATNSRYSASGIAYRFTGQSSYTTLTPTNRRYYEISNWGTSSGTFLTSLRFNFDHSDTWEKNQFFRLHFFMNVFLGNTPVGFSSFQPTPEAPQYVVFDNVDVDYEPDCNNFYWYDVGTQQRAPVLINNDNVYENLACWGIYEIEIEGHFAADYNYKYISLTGQLFTSSAGVISIVYISNPSLYLYEPYSATSEAIKEQTEQEQKNREQDQQNLDNAQSSADSAGGSSSSDATSAGTTLLAGFSSFTSALANTSASDCKLKMDMGNLNLGDVDLCSLSIPAPLQALSSIILIAFCVPLSLATAKKLIGLFRSFQT